METIRILLNDKEIERRKSIKQFGDISNIKILEVVENLQFSCSSSDNSVELFQETKPQTIYNPIVDIISTTESSTSTYKPPMRSSQTVSVKISNYPLDMNREEVYKVIISHTNVNFGRFHMVMDREKNISKGYSFVTVDNKEDANKLIGDLRNVVIDNLRLSVEFAKN